MANAINWFEIPATDLDRASRFYTEILQKDVPVVDFGGLKMAMLPGGQEEVTGALVQHEGYIPSESAGTLIYLNGGENLQQVLDRIEPAGGKVLMPKTQISEEVGYMALFLDSEGNRLALHSPK